MAETSKVVEMKKEKEHLMVMKITPEIARAWLETNIHNRPVNETVIARYAEAMKSGQWERNGETIKFADTGALLDGQHRLKAVIQSGVTVETYVVFNLPQKVFDTIDTGKSRTITDLLALDGEPHGNVMGPALRLLYVHDEFGSPTEMGKRLARLITNRDLMETRQRHPELEQSVGFVTGVKGLNKYMGPASAAYLHYMFAKLQPHLADSFFIRLARAQDMEDDHPIFVLRRRLEGMSKATDADRLEALAITIKAWNIYRQRKTVKLLRWSRVEDFPVAQ